MDIGWPTHVFHTNIDDDNYVIEIYNWLMQKYSMQEQWPTNNTDIDVFKHPKHNTELYSKLETFINSNVEQYCQTVFKLDDDDCAKLQTKTHVSNHQNILGHQHSGSVVSGLFYIRAPEGANLTLSDPRSNAVRGYPDPFKHYFNPKTIVPKDGDIVLFPSYLWHEVGSVANSNRITMPFDTFYDYD